MKVETDTVLATTFIETNALPLSHATTNLHLLVSWWAL